jgi:hypothetical protein
MQQKSVDGLRELVDFTKTKQLGRAGSQPPSGPGNNAPQKSNRGEDL